MVSVSSASRHITSASRYHPRYQSRSSMNIRGLIAEMAKAVPNQGRMDLPGETLEHKISYCFPRGARTSIFKEVYSRL